MMRSASHPHRRLPGLLLTFGALWLAGSLFAVESWADDDKGTPTAEPSTEPTADGSASEASGASDAPTAAGDTKGSVEAPPTGPPKAPRARAKKACLGGWIADDGSADAGYGFVPSAREGIYVQQIQSGDFPSKRLDEVCVCLYKGLAKRRAEFDIVFYEDQNGRPAAEPYASLPARARIEPKKYREAEFFFEVDASTVEIPEGSSFVGVRWDPKEQFHLFICGDKTESTASRQGFYTEDRAKGWNQIATSRDPIFRDHRSLMVRVRAQEPPAEGAGEGEPAAASTDAAAAETAEAGSGSGAQQAGGGT